MSAKKTKQPPIKTCPHDRIYAVVCVLGDQYQSMLWCTVCHGTKTVELHMTREYVWFDPSKFTDFAKLDGVSAELVAGPSSDHNAILTAALRDHEARRTAYIRSGYDQALSTRDWANYTETKAKRVRDFFEFAYASDVEKLRVQVDEKLRQLVG